jgi:hypothetical protein
MDFERSSIIWRFYDSEFNVNRSALGRQMSIQYSDIPHARHVASEVA